MPTSRLFAGCPEFPANVPVAANPSLILNRLDGRESETTLTQLYQACHQYGYFSLDLRGSTKGEQLLNAAERMFDVATQTFDLGKDVLAKFAAGFPEDHRGYKFAGQFQTENGRPDECEVYTVGQDDVTGIGMPKEKPDLLTDRRADCEDFVHSAHQVTTVIFNALDRALDLKKGTLIGLHPIHKPSPTSFRLVRSRPQELTRNFEDGIDHITMAGHTDIGTITLVFNVVGGLQILPAGQANISQNWRYVKPEVGCVFVQIADTLVEWTGGLLRSNLHRVIGPPGSQAGSIRQSLVYLARPASGGSMERLKGGRIIPSLATGEEDETRSPDEWAAWRTKQIMAGELKLSSRGGITV